MIEGEDADRRGGEGFAHLQAAARELINAARAVLDVAEELVDDPATVGVVAEAVGSVMQTAADVGRRAMEHATGAAGSGEDLDTDPDAEDQRTRDRTDAGRGSRSGVERIRIG